MDLRIVWTEADLDELERVPGGAFLAFDRLATERLRAEGREVYFVDDLLSWDERDALEAAVSERLRQIRGEIGDEVIAPGYPLAEAGDHELRIEWTNALRTQLVASKVVPSHGPTQVVATQHCPTSVALGARAAVGQVSSAVLMAASEAFVPAAGPAPERLLTRLLRPVLSLPVSSRLSRIRVLAIPGGKVGSALDALAREQLEAAGVGVALFRGLVHGDAARLAVRKRVPFVVPKASPLSNGAGGPRQIDTSTSADPLATVIGLLASVFFARARATARLIVAATPSLENARACKAIVLPTTAVPAARMLRLWAVQRGIVCAVVQHGVYGLRDWDKGDRDADVLLAWGPGVRGQFSAGTDVRPVGVPGIPQQLTDPSNSDKRRRILIATTNAPFGSALGSHGFCEEFIECLIPSLARLVGEGYEIVLRPHPSEDRERYTRLLGSNMQHVHVSRTPRFADDAAPSALVISSMSSAAVEAAALGIPVALWIAMPLEVRRRYLLPPFDRVLPATFSDADDFGVLATSLVRADGIALEQMRELSHRLGAYAEPFRADRLTEELVALGD